MENQENKQKNHNVFYVGLLSFFGGISQDIFSPILPIYLTTILGFTKTFVGTAEGIVAASATLFAVVAGYFSDKFKKQKPIVFAGYLLSMISRPLLALFTSGAAVLGLRLTDGIGKGIKDPPKDVLVAGSAEKEVRGKSFGIARMLDTLGSVAGPLILVALLYFLQGSAMLYHYILLFSAIPLLITLFVLVTKIREVYPTKTENIIVEMEGSGKLPRSFFIFLFIAVIFAIGNSSDAFLILRAKGIGLTLIEIPAVIALFNFIYALAAVPMGSLSDKIGRVPTVLIGWTTYALVYVGFGLAIHPTAIWFLYALYGIYYAANFGVVKALLADMVGIEHRGRAFGIYGTVIGLATFPASLFAGLLWDRIGPHAPFYFGAVMAGIATILLLSFSRKLKTA